MIFGYCRISTKKQSIDRQIKNIKEAYADAVIVTEEYTGTTTNRPAWNNLCKRLRSGDIVVFDEVSRMSRNAAEGFALYKKLYDEGVQLVFLKEHHLDTENFRQALQSRVPLTDTDIDCILKGVNEYLMLLAKRQIEIAFERAEAEVNYLHKRTREGIAAAAAAGKQIGQKKGAKLTTKKSVEAKKIILKHSKCFGGALSNEEVWRLAGISKMTFYKYQKELLEQLDNK